MVSELSRRGLIVSSAQPTSGCLEELISETNWPVLLKPNLRLLLQQIEVNGPHCLLFWLDETHAVDDALKLIVRLRDRGSRPYRVAIAHQLQADVEPLIRSAGVHSVLNTNGSMTALVQNALLPLLHLQSEPTFADREAFQPGERLIRGPTIVRASPAEMHPP